MSQIALDGELINLKSCKVELSMQLADLDMSGQTSSTASSEQGDKAKELKVTGLIPFTDRAQLSRLFELALAKDEAGNRVIRRIGSDLARTVKIRQVRFFGQITAPEHSTLMAWNVSFNLREYLSIPEVAEQRQVQTAAAVGQSTEQTASVIPTAAIAKAPPQVEVSSMEKFLTGIDNIIGEPA
ncbi:DNA-binding protein [Shewanella psychrotolerans]|uniref:baseplate complex protein n=1 Tax=Shewanella psychrotolerans TaxID=2864206 RepID=UPI001C65DB03|nr:DNA-binding protein [Shewanella psychrotolerans]QYK02455.1 DNA-binding protein [Shewanella psychrotolerans]